MILRVDDDSWNISDKTEQLKQNIDQARGEIMEYLDVLQKKEPMIAIGKHHYNPYKCEFAAYCNKKNELD